MKNLILLCFCWGPIVLKCQIQQNINKPSGTVSNAIAEIDSIRFNAASQEMLVVLESGQTENHTLGDIDNITFSTNQSSLAHSCGTEGVHNPALTYGSMTDQEGNVYKTIVIGTQEWMAENLISSIYQNGDPIPNIIDSIQWAGLISGAWCYYNNDSGFECPYGKLYNNYAVTDPRNICPTGWHAPTYAEWSVLINYLDPNADGGTVFTNVAGGKLKSASLQYWLNPNLDATNESGFSGLPGGLRGGDGSFTAIGVFGFWWSSSQAYSVYNAWSYRLLNSAVNALRASPGKECGFSVRCLRD